MPCADEPHMPAVSRQHATRCVTSRVSKTDARTLRTTRVYAYDANIRRAYAQDAQTRFKIYDEDVHMMSRQARGNIMRRCRDITLCRYATVPRTLLTFARKDDTRRHIAAVALPPA